MFFLEKIKKEHVLLNKRFQYLTVSEKVDFKKQLDSIIGARV